jgi:hypothetical protein
MLETLTFTLKKGDQHVEPEKKVVVEERIEELEDKVAPDIWDWLEELTSGPGPARGRITPAWRRQEALEMLSHIK